LEFKAGKSTAQLVFTPGAAVVAPFYRCGEIKASKASHEMDLALQLSFFSCIRFRFNGGYKTAETRAGKCNFFTLHTVSEQLLKNECKLPL
jgi:hypothetical protein